MKSNWTRTLDRVRVARGDESEGDAPIDAWVPDYRNECSACGRTPCVTGVYAGKVVYRAGMCGICVWGESSCADPQTWSKQ
jgi:hypothetical protein